jgi:exopolysaccharide biosynthesis protein
MIILAMLSANTYGSVLYKERTEQTITKGATLIKEKVLTHEGWQDINILKVNLQDDNIAVRPIESPVLGERKTILDMANNSGAIAGINSDFFDTATNNTPSFGPVIADGKLKHGYNNNFFSLGPAKNMATFLLGTDNTPEVAYYGTSIMLYANGEAIGGMASYNNIPTTLSRPIVLDYTYQQDTSKVLSKFKGVYTVVVENGQVTYLAKQDESVPIPKNGYAILIGTQDATAYYDALPLGTPVEIKNTIYLNNDITKAIEDVKLGVGGSGIIMKDGSEYTGPAHKVTADTRAPRSVVATLKNSNELLLIAIDGRNKTLGVNHKDLVSLLQSYNVKDAMYFDGGGSTTLVSRNEAEKEVKLQNNPSDGTQRKVVNGLGVFTTSQPGNLNKLYLSAVHNRTFIGEPIAFTVKGVDKNYNPVDLSKTNVTMTVTGVNGSFKNGMFYPETAGKALIIASYSGIDAAKEIYITDKPVGIKIEPSNLQLSPNSSKDIQLYGIDREGYRIPISQEKITWKSSSQEVSAKGNKVTAAGKTLATLTATYKDISAKLGVIVGDTAAPIESFEKNSGVWGGDQATVKGKVEPSKEFKYHGDTSIKMTYTFLKSPNKQVAYTVFNAPIEITEDAMSINMWVYAKKQGDTAKIELIDKAGKKFYLKLTDELNFEGWKYLSVSLPQNMTFPAKVSKFYTYANSVGEKRTNVVYIDHMSVTRGFRDKEGITVRNDYKFDPLYKDSLQAPKANQYMINVMGSTKVSSMILNKDTITGLGKQLSQDVGLVLFTSKSNIDLPISVSKYSYDNTYRTVDYNQTKVIFAGTDKGGLRVTDATTWLNLKKDIESTTAKNIILVMSKNPLTQFDDPQEGLALHKYLKTQKEISGKNVFVVYSGENGKEVRIEDGIRYIRNSGLNVATDTVQDCNYIKFKIVGNEIYYTFEKIK